jgi:SdpC family antimicrobial peptide
MLYTLRKLTSRWYMMPPLFGLLILISCHRQEISRTASHPNWSGQQLFKGLFLMDGPVADRIHTYTTLQQKYRFDQQPELKQKLARMGDQFVMAIDKGYPVFFADFQRAIQSGDHLQVEAAMTQGNKMLQYAIQQDPQLNPMDSKGMEIASKLDVAQVTDAQGHLDEAKLDAIADKYRSAGIDGKSNTRIITDFTVNCGLILYCQIVLSTSRIIHILVDISNSVFYLPASSNASAQAGLQREMIIQEITDQLALDTPFNTQPASL